MRNPASALALLWLGFLACSSSTSGTGASNESTGGANAAGGTSSSSADSISGGSSATDTGGTQAVPASGGGLSTGGASQSSNTAVSTGGTKASTGGANATGGASHATSAPSTGGSKPASGGSSAVGGTANTTGGTKTTTISATSATGGVSSTGGTTSSEPSAQDLLNKVTACSATATVAATGFGLDSGAGNISMYQCQGAVFWKADLDVDCDGIQTPPCDTDIHGQPQTSIVDYAPSGDVDPTLLPYFVIPLGDPETDWYKSVGIELGQVGAVIYKGAVRYGIFADEAGGAFIGEASYAMCQLFLGKPTATKDPCDPNEGGIDPAEVTYVTFTGASNRATGADIYSHDKHTSMGIAAAKAWVSQ